MVQEGSGETVGRGLRVSPLFVQDIAGCRLMSAEA
jgi:hypothetical protein